jgi:hypothetical protein
MYTMPESLREKKIPWDENCNLKEPINCPVCGKHDDWSFENHCECGCVYSVLNKGDHILIQY